MGRLLDGGTLVGRGILRLLNGLPTSVLVEDTVYGLDGWTSGWIDG